MHHPADSSVFSLLPFLFQYDVVPIQPNAVICSCSHSSMVRNHPDSCSPLAIPGASSMEGSVPQACAVGATGRGQSSDERAQPAVQVPQPRKKKPEDFKFGKILGEGSFSTVCNSLTRSAFEFYPGRCYYMLAFFWLMLLSESSWIHLRWIIYLFFTSPFLNCFSLFIFSLRLS